MVVNFHEETDAITILTPLIYGYEKENDMFIIIAILTFFLY